jgi:ATP-dependent RNA helicase DDX18/HAS1
MSLSQPQNGDGPKETGKGGKAKRALKRSVAVDSAEAQSGGMPEKTLENAKVKKSPQKLTTLANGKAAPTPPPDSEVKKKKRKKRKMANDAGPDTKKSKN